MPLPQTGLPADEVLDRLATMRSQDTQWEAGRAFSLVYSAGEEAHDLLRQVAGAFLAENALNTAAFPSLGQMQKDVVDITADLLAGGPDAAGFMTSGGTESILLAVKAARNWGRDQGVDRPQMVLPASAHAAFSKASAYFGIEAVRVPVGPDWRADPAAMAEAMTERTVLLVASAPSYPQGVVDPVPEVAALAAERGILCHVDACMGGFLLPFLERLGRFDKPWNLAVDGVTSMSADLHKYGYASKGASVVVYRDKHLRRHQTFVTDDWLGGVYGSSGLAGTKPAGPIAGAWAILHHLGEDGYLRRAAATLDAAQALIAGVRTTPGLTVLGEPDATLYATAAEPGGPDVFAVGDVLLRKGWFLDRQGPPDSLHSTVNALHLPVVDEYLADLAAAVEEVGAATTGDRAAIYGTVE